MKSIYMQNDQTADAGFNSDQQCLFLSEFYNLQILLLPKHRSFYTLQIKVSIVHYSIYTEQVTASKKSGLNGLNIWYFNHILFIFRSLSSVIHQHLIFIYFQILIYETQPTFPTILYLTNSEPRTAEGM